MTLNFLQDALRIDEHVAHSNADSGVENESDSSRSGSIQAEDNTEADDKRVPEEEERRSSALYEQKLPSPSTIKVVDSTQPGTSRAGQNFVKIDIETGDTTDDDLSSEDEETNTYDQKFDKQTMKNAHEVTQKKSVTFGSNKVNIKPEITTEQEPTLGVREQDNIEEEMVTSLWTMSGKILLFWKQ